MTSTIAEREREWFDSGETADIGFVLLAMDRGLKKGQRQKFVRIGTRAVRPTIEPSTEAVFFELDGQRFGDDEVDAIPAELWETVTPDFPHQGVLVEGISAEIYRENLNDPQRLEQVQPAGLASALHP